MLGLTDCVACDDAVDWCLLGYDDGPHMLVAMKGLTIVGEIESNVADPSGALDALGVEASAAEQILVP